MKRELSILTKIGIIIYVVYSLVDRFIVGIPDIIAIPIMIIGIALMTIGNLKTSRDSTIK